MGGGAIRIQQFATGPLGSGYPSTMGNACPLALRSLATRFVGSNPHGCFGCPGGDLRTAINLHTRWKQVLRATTELGDGILWRSENHWATTSNELPPAWNGMRADYLRQIETRGDPQPSNNSKG